MIQTKEILHLKMERVGKMYKLEYLKPLIFLLDDTYYYRRKQNKMMMNLSKNYFNNQNILKAKRIILYQSLIMDLLKKLYNILKRLTNYNQNSHILHKMLLFSLYNYFLKKMKVGKPKLSVSIATLDNTDHLWIDCK